MPGKVCKESCTGRTADNGGKMYTLRELIQKLKYYRKLKLLTDQQFRTLRERAVSGDINGAEKQFERMIGRVKRYD